MSYGQLSKVFRSFAWKELTAVEADARASNGHEFNSSSRLREILGNTEREQKKGAGIQTRFIYLSDNDDEPLVALGTLSWYDSRKAIKHRTPEWRLYYSDNQVIGREGRASAKDFLVIAFTANIESATVFIAEAGSTSERQLRWLFGITESQQVIFGTAEVANSQMLDMTRTKILESAGIIVLTEDQTLLEIMLNKFGAVFPTTSVFGNFVRSNLPDVRAEDNPDHALTEWMEQEEFAFRVLEKHIVGERLKTGFKDVDDFIQCSLSVHNRRKSRAGLAFENHLAEVFRVNHLVFERTAKLENKAKPDFLFPGEKKYFDNDFPVELLTLLGAKTTCKDRWRQVLAEGPKIRNKHLVTLEPAISSGQLREMRNHHLQLVVPASLISTYPQTERDDIWNLATFIEDVKTKQLKSFTITKNS